jgi:hypothetical protein
MRTSMKAERWMFVRVGMSERVAGRRWRGIVVVEWVLGELLVMGNGMLK